MRWLIVILTMLMTAKSVPVGGQLAIEEKKPNLFSSLMDNAVDSDSDATFDSLDFCSTRIHGNVKTDQVERDHLIISPFKFGLATAGIMKCIILVDAVLLPWNIAKQTIRDTKEMEWKKADFWSMMSQLFGIPSSLARSILVSPLKTLVRLGGVLFGAIMAYASVDQLAY